MSIPASLVQELRQRTGAGMMDCKKALTAANGDIETAIEDMRKSGQLKAAKKAGRVAAEGVIVIKTSDDNKIAAILEVNSETDFAARDENFKTFVDAVSAAALAGKINDIEALLNHNLGNSETVEQARQALVAKIGENINLRRVNLVETDGVLGSYLHSGRIGVLVNLKGGSTDLAKDIAMHIAASHPQFVSPSDVSEELIEKEKEIYAAQAKESGKPAEIIEKMIGGRIKKFLDEVSLLGQPFVKDADKTVGTLLKSENAEVMNFIRFEVGEGIEKKQDDFAEEVMAQVRDSQGEEA